MWETNASLMELAGSEVLREKVGQQGVNELLGRWRVLNYIRGGFAAVGGVVGLVALVGGVE